MMEDLLALTAECPECHASLREDGLGWKKFRDELWSMSVALDILDQIEARWGEEISKELCDIVIARVKAKCGIDISEGRNRSPTFSEAVMYTMDTIHPLYEAGIRDLIEAVRLCSPPDSLALRCSEGGSAAEAGDTSAMHFPVVTAEEAVMAALRLAHPEAPAELDFSIPLRHAVESPGKQS